MAVLAAAQRRAHIRLILRLGRQQSEPDALIGGPAVDIHAVWIRHVVGEYRRSSVARRHVGKVIKRLQAHQERHVRSRLGGAKWDFDVRLPGHRQYVQFGKSFEVDCPLHRGSRRHRDRAW